MADMNKKSMEDLSKEEIHEQIENDKKQAKRSTVFAITALIAIIVLCIAWFVANNLVKGTSGAISGKSNNPFELASVGSTRQDNNKLPLTDGKSEKIKSYYDCEAGKMVDKEQDYQVGIADLAWYANDRKAMYPGERGKLEFYLIPTQAGAGRTEAEVTLNMEAYQVSADDNKAEKYADATLQKLVNGHVLLFQNLNNTKGYSGWLYREGVNKITVKAPDGGFQKGVPYKVTVYWIWPKYFRNYVYNSRSAYGDLFADITDNADYTNLNIYVNAHKENLLYGGTIADEINSSIPDEVLDNCSKYYDQADEYIGQKKCYIYIDASVQ